MGCLVKACQIQKDGMLEVVYFYEQRNHELIHYPMKHMLSKKEILHLLKKLLQMMSRSLEYK